MRTLLLIAVAALFTACQKDAVEQQVRYKVSCGHCYVSYNTGGDHYERLWLEGTMTEQGDTLVYQRVGIDQTVSVEHDSDIRLMVQNATDNPDTAIASIWVNGGLLRTDTLIGASTSMDLQY